ncbi:MAG: hypothetical protein ACRC3G_05955 [Bacteroidales bacterium]
MTDYKKLLGNIESRLNPHKELVKERMLFSDLSDAPTDVLKYIKLSMRGVEPEYTQISKDAGERVKTHLSSLSNVTFRYQGSVMTNTHIKGVSDIDLLTICDKFYSWDGIGVRNILNSSTERTRFYSSQITKLENETKLSPYIGNSLSDLMQLRLDSENILSQKYTQFDASNGKAIKIKNLSLNRDVDVVTASWHDNVNSIINDKGDYRGIQVYDKNKHKNCPADYPFLSIKRINDRGSDTNDRLKKMIRFLKNIKANSTQNIELSSFDINAICYDIEVAKYAHISYVELVSVLYLQIFDICTDKKHSDSVVSVDGNEYIFRYNSNKLENLKKLLSEVQSILLDLRS